RDLGGGFLGVADPFAWLLALLGTLTFWAPSESIVALYVAALPLAALGGWFAAARLSSRPWPRVFGAAVWALAPTFLLALDGGRLGAVLAHLLLPWLVFAVAGARRSWAASATASLLAAGVLAGAPSLWPALLTAWVVGTVVLAVAGRRGRGWHRLLPLPIPALALFLPLAVQHVIRGTPLGVFADPGVPLAPPTGGVLGGPVGEVLAFVAGIPDTSAVAWNSLADAGVTTTVAIALGIALAAPLVVLAFAAAFLPSAPRALVLLAAAGLGFVTAVIASRVPVAATGEALVTAWPGAGLSLAWLGLGGAAILGLAAGAIKVRLLRGVAGSVVATGVAVAALPLLVAAATGAGGVSAGSGRTLPALVAAEAAADPGIGTLILDAQSGAGLGVALERGSGARLDEQSTLYSAAPSGTSIDGIAELAANLASRSGYDPVPQLEQQHIGFVMLATGSPGTRVVHDRAAAALDGNPLFVPVTETDDGRLWRYVGLDAGLPADAPTGPSTLGTPLGAAMLGVQLLVLLLTLLLALPSGQIADRVRPEREIRRGSGLRTGPPRALAVAGGVRAD
ncbi:MAG TPA: glycosyltransferase family 2 protein, partial [Naasia sp.]